MKKYAVRLDSSGANKLGIINLIRQNTGMGLHEAKQLVDNLPQVVVRHLTEMSATTIASQFREAGAQVSVVEDVEDTEIQEKKKTTQNRMSPDEIAEQKNKLSAKSAEIEKHQSSGCLVFFLCVLGVGFVFGGTGISGGLALLLSIVVFVVVLVLRGNDKQRQLNEVRSKVEKEQEIKRNMMEQVFEQATAKGFNVSAKVTDPQNRFCIATDNWAKNFLVKNSLGAEYHIYKYSDLIDFELSQDGVSTIASRAGDALVGGVLFGATGAVIGASQSKDIQEYCSSLYIALTLNSSSGFRVQIPFISRKVPKSTSEYSLAVERAKEMIALLQLIKNSNETELRVSCTAQTDKPGINTASMDAIKQYKELLDLGIISQEEFDLKRKELLNI